jgi:alpha-tubulin suppressor-like RCC1 family protein
MKNKNILLPALLSIVLVFSLILLGSVAEASSARLSLLDNHAITHSAVDSSNAASTMALNMSSVMAQGQATPMVAAGDNDLGCCDVGSWQNITQVDAGYRHTVGLKADGTVVAVRDNEENNYGECNVGGWTNITQVAAGAYHTVGLKADGTVVAVGRNDEGECNVGGWTGIIQVDAGGGLAGGHTVGRKADGTVVAVGRNVEGQCDIGGWAGIIQLLAGRHYTVGLKADGTAVAVGRNYYGQCDVGGWTGIIQIDPGAWHTVGLKADGTVVAVGCIGWNAQWGQCEVCNWTGIIHASAGGYHTVGLKADRTVVAVGENAVGQCDVGDWTDIIQVDAGKWHTVGLKADGTVVAVGDKPVVSRLCFIATAAYGTPMAEEVEILREFRDAYLLTNPVGQALVDFYYKVSPPMAEFITEHPSLKPIVRAGLVPAVAMSTVAVNTTPAEKAAIVGLVALVSVALAIWAKRRRGRGPEYT